MITRARNLSFSAHAQQGAEHALERDAENNNFFALISSSQKEPTEASVAPLSMLEVTRRRSSSLVPTMHEPPSVNPGPAVQPLVAPVAGGSGVPSPKNDGLSWAGWSACSDGASMSADRHPYGASEGVFVRLQSPFTPPPEGSPFGRERPAKGSQLSSPPGGFLSLSFVRGDSLVESFAAASAPPSSNKSATLAAPVHSAPPAPPSVPPAPILVLGASGLLGAHIVAGLLAAGHSVRLMCASGDDSLISEAHKIAPPDFLGTRLTVLRGSDFKAALANVETVVYLCPSSIFRPNSPFARSNRRGPTSRPSTAHVAHATQLVFTPNASMSASMSSSSAQRAASFAAADDFVTAEELERIMAEDVRDTLMALVAHRRRTLARVVFVTPAQPDSSPSEAFDACWEDALQPSEEDCAEAPTPSSVRALVSSLLSQLPLSPSKREGDCSPAYSDPPLSRAHSCGNMTNGRRRHRPRYSPKDGHRNDICPVFATAHTAGLRVAEAVAKKGRLPIVFVSHGTPVGPPLTSATSELADIIHRYAQSGAHTSPLAQTDITEIDPTKQWLRLSPMALVVREVVAAVDARDPPADDIPHCCSQRVPSVAINTHQLQRLARSSSAPPLVRDMTSTADTCCWSTMLIQQLREAVTRTAETMAARSALESRRSGRSSVASPGRERTPPTPLRGVPPCDPRQDGDALPHRLRGVWPHVSLETVMGLGAVTLAVVCACTFMRARA